MKKIPLLIALCSVFFVPAFGQGWEWAKEVGGVTGGTYFDKAMSVTTDGGRNVYVTGYFDSPEMLAGTTTLINNGLTNIFLIKYDSSGNVIWAKNAGGFLEDFAYSVAADPWGNVYITGTFGSPSITFGTTTLTDTGTGTNNIFLVKYDSSGNVVWAKSAPGNGYDAANAVTTDLWGGVYITGFYRYTTITFGATTFTSAGYDDIFLAKYDTAGNVIWAKSVGGDGYEYANSVKTDLSGNVYITGFFQSSQLVFGPDTLTTGGIGIGSVFLAKYDSSGAVLWAKGAGGMTSSIAAGIGHSVTTDTSANIYIAGYFTSPIIIFGNDTLHNGIDTGGKNNIFLVKYDATGHVLWAKGIADTSTANAYSVTTDQSGSVYLTGTFQSPNITFGTTTLTTAGIYENIFLVKYAAAGNVLWAISAGGSNPDVGNSVATDQSGRVYVAGFFESPTIDFGSSILSNPHDWSDIFLAKYNDVPLYFPVVDNRSSEIILYPNPVTNKLVIVSSELITRINITNLLGQTVSSCFYNSNSIQVDVSEFPNGMYFVTVNGTGVRKFVKE